MEQRNFCTLISSGQRINIFRKLVPQGSVRTSATDLFIYNDTNSQSYATRHDRAINSVNTYADCFTVARAQSRRITA
jgi:hypothetical protein